MTPIKNTDSGAGFLAAKDAEIRELRANNERLSERVEELEADLADIREQFHSQEQRNVEQRQVLVRTRNRDVKRLRNRQKAVVAAWRKWLAAPSWGWADYGVLRAAMAELEQGVTDDT